MKWMREGIPIITMYSFIPFIPYHCPARENHQIWGLKPSYPPNISFLISYSENYPPCAKLTLRPWKWMTSGKRSGFPSFPFAVPLYVTCFFFRKGGEPKQCSVLRGSLLRLEYLLEFGFSMHRGNAAGGEKKFWWSVGGCVFFLRGWNKYVWVFCKGVHPVSWNLVGLY